MIARVAGLVAFVMVADALGGRTARAQLSVGDGAAPPPSAPSLVDPAHRSVGAAVGLSLAGTAAGLVAVAGLAHDPSRDRVGAAFGFAILSFGPSAGELYAGAPWRTLIFSGARGLCSTLFLYEYVTGHLGGEQPRASADDAASIAIGGLFGLILISIFDSGIAARDFNVRHAPPGGPKIALTPLLVPGRNDAGDRAPIGTGLALAGSF